MHHTAEVYLAIIAPAKVFERKAFLLIFLGYLLMNEWINEQTNEWCEESGKKLQYGREYILTCSIEMKCFDLYIFFFYFQ